MARTRQIKPEFWTDDDVVTLGMAAKLLFIGMWNLADREGRLENKPMSILLRILPTETKLDPALIIGELVARNLMIRYEVDGRPYLQIRSFKKHQHVHPHEAQSTLPPPPTEKASDSNGPVHYTASPVIPGNVSECQPTSGFRLLTSDLKEKPPSPSARGFVYPPEFESFWEAAQSNRDKGLKSDALKAWNQRGKPTAAQLTAGWSAYMASLGDTYAKNVSSWIRARGWEENYAQAAVIRPAFRKSTAEDRR